MTPEPNPDAAEPDDYLDPFLVSAFRTTLDAEKPAPERLEERLATIGPYRVLGRVGSGGVGDVYRVEDATLGRELACKVLRLAHRGDREIERRFREEARLCSQLAHPGIVPVHELGTLADDRPYFTMKLVEGRTLAQILRARRDLAAERPEHLAVLAKVCEAMAYAHARRVVHGDLKPHNVMVGAFGEVQVMDWGFALQTAPATEGGQTPASESSSRSGGTPAYMAPEQAQRNHLLTARTDVFGLGAILCEILTGEPPYSGGSRQALVAQAAEGKLAGASARLASSGADPQLVALALDCLAAQPLARPANAGELATRLRGYLDGLEARARRKELEAAAAQASLVASRRARRLELGLSGAVLAAVLVVTGLLLWSGRRAAERSREVGRAVAEALADAVRLDGQARTRGALGPLREAVAAAQRAAALAATPDGSDTLRQQASTLAADLEAQLLRREREERLLPRLVAITPILGDERPPAELERDFLAAFADVRIDGRLPPGPDALERIRGYAPDPRLIHALDTWMHVRRRHALPDAEAWRIPLSLVGALDPDPWRAELRAAYAARDLERLRAVASDGRTEQHPAASQEFLAGCLWELGARDEALALLRRAHARYPGDYRVSHNLAVQLDRRDAANVREAVRLLWMSVAARPDDDHLRTDLALYLVEDGRPAEAIEQLEVAKSLAPQAPRTWFLIGLAKERLGEPKASRAAYEEAARLGHGMACTMLATQLLGEARYDRALDLLRQALERSPGDALARLQLGAVLTEVGRAAEALPLLEAAVAAQGDSAEAHAYLGVAMLEAGRFRDSLRELSAAQDLPPPTTAWRLDEWLASARSALAAERMLANLDPEREMAASEGIHLAWTARRTGHADLALRLLEPILADRSAEPRFLLTARTEAACAAGALWQATTGDADRRVELATKALDWLRKILDDVRAEHASGAMPARALRGTLLRLRLNAALEPLAGPAAGPGLAAFWAELDRTLAALGD